MILVLPPQEVAAPNQDRFPASKGIVTKLGHGTVDGESDRFCIHRWLLSVFRQ
jgi:hypothetical protein